MFAAVETSHSGALRGACPWRSRQGGRGLDADRLRQNHDRGDDLNHAIRFWQANYLRSGLVGIGIGHEVGRTGKLSYEFELQAVQHFGSQDNFEVNVPLILRYNRHGDVLPALQSVAFGVGLSWASVKPETEVERDGDSTQTMIYLIGELAFDLPNTDLELVTRIHHRSDGYRLFPVDTISNAFAFGFRKRF